VPGRQERRQVQIHCLHQRPRRPGIDIKTRFKLMDMVFSDMSDLFTLADQHLHSVCKVGSLPPRVGIHKGVVPSQRHQPCERGDDLAPVPDIDRVGGPQGPVHRAHSALAWCRRLLVGISTHTCRVNMPAITAPVSPAMCPGRRAGAGRHATCGYRARAPHQDAVSCPNTGRCICRFRHLLPELLRPDASGFICESLHEDAGGRCPRIRGRHDGLYVVRPCPRRPPNPRRPTVASLTALTILDPNTIAPLHGLPTDGPLSRRRMRLLVRDGLCPRGRRLDSLDSLDSLTASCPLSDTSTGPELDDLTVGTLECGCQFFLSVCLRLLRPEVADYTPRWTEAIRVLTHHCLAVGGYCYVFLTSELRIRL
jgi:hypothetical protein